MLVTTILALLHVFFAIGWLGGGLMFGFVIAPMLGRLAPASTSDFFVKVGPRVLLYFRVVPTLTVVFGVLLLGSMLHDGGNTLSPSTSWGLDLLVGLSVAVAALVVFEAVATPALAEIIRLLSEARASGSTTPPPELASTIRRTTQASVVTLVLLLITLGCMVAAGFS